MIHSWDAARERALVTAIQDGDEAAFTEVYRTLYEMLHRLAYRVLRSSDLANDVVQDVFARLWRERATWEVRETIPAFLNRAVRNRALDLLRRERRKRPPPTASFVRARQDLADDMLHETALQEAIEELLPSLSPRGRDVLLLSLTGDLTYAEIGAHLGIARNTVRVNLIESRRRLYRGLIRLGLLDD